MRRYLKVLICAVLITALLFSLSCSAHALGLLNGQQFGAWIAAGLTAMNILGGQVFAIQQGEVYFTPEYQTYMSDPLPPDGSNFYYRTPSETLSDYLNAATIKVSKGVTTIDGVVYDELWVSPGTFTNGLKTNLFDFKTKWAILSGNAGTLATGAGFIDNTPVYTIGGVTSTQAVSVPTETVPAYYQLFPSIYAQCETNRLLYGSNELGWTVGWANNRWRQGYYAQLRPANNNTSVAFWSKATASSPNWILGTTYPVGALQIDMTPFDFSYVSGVIPATESDIPDDYGLSIQVPHDKLQTFYTAYPQYNVDNSVINIQQDEINIDELTQAIFDQITKMDEIKGGWTEEPEPEPEPPEPAPVPDPEPDPYPDPQPEPYPDPIPSGDETIAESPWKSLVNGLKNLFDNISIGNQAIQTTANFINQIKNFLSNILSEVKQIGNRIVEGDRTWFENVVDSIKAPFLPWLDIFKSGVSIWRYVVTWINNISGPFAYFINILVTINPILVSPFYAIAAGAVVIAIYKRFGR